MAPFDRSPLYSNYVHIVHRFWDIARYWSKVAYSNLPNPYLTSPLGWPVTTLVFCQDLWHQKTIECQDNVWRCLRERDPMFSRLLTDRRTDRQTEGHMVTAHRNRLSRKLLYGQLVNREAFPRPARYRRASADCKKETRSSGWLKMSKEIHGYNMRCVGSTNRWEVPSLTSEASFRPR